MLRVARRLGESEPVTAKTTYLGAHALPPAFDRRPADYIDSVVAQLPQVAASGLADAVYAFRARISLYPAQVPRGFAAPTLLGLPVTLHSVPLSDSNAPNPVARPAGH